MVDDCDKGMESAQPPISEEVTETGVEQQAQDLAAEVEKAKAQAEEYLDQWRRTAAEFSNYRKRTDREREEVTRFANSQLLTQLLPVLDDVDRAMATLPADVSRLSWVEGVVLIQRKLEYTLEQEGLKRFEATGQPFDPERHHAMLREETTAYPDGQVIADLQCGYEYNGRVLRPAMVKVAVAPPVTAEGTAGTEEEQVGGST